RTKEVLPAILVCGISFAVAQGLSANFLGYQLPDILSAIVSLICLVVFLRIWQPKSTFYFKDEQPQTDGAGVAAGDGPETAVDTRKTYTPRQLVKAWSPFVVLIVTVILWGGFDWVKNILAVGTFNIPVAGLNDNV